MHLCTCGSGGHPRRCAEHPERFARHVAELNAENRADDKAAGAPAGDCLRCFGEGETACPECWTAAQPEVV